MRKKEFYESKKAVFLSSVDANKIIVIKLKETMKQVKFLLVTWMISVVLSHLYVLFCHK